MLTGAPPGNSTPQLRSWVLQNRPNTIADYFLKSVPPVAGPTINIRDIGSPQPGVNKFSSTPDGIPDLGTVQYLTTQGARSSQYTIRIDHELTSRQRPALWLLLQAECPDHHPGIRPAFLRPSPTFGAFGNLVYSRTISPSTLNEVRFAAARFIGHYCAPKTPKTPVGGGLSCPDMLNKQVPGINITGVGTVRDVNLLPGGFFPTVYQFKDTGTPIANQTSAPTPTRITAGPPAPSAHPANPGSAPPTV